MAQTVQWLSESEQAAWRGLIAMQSRMRAHLGRQLQRHSGLSEPDYAILVELSEAPQGRLRLGDLGARLDWEKSRLSKQVSRMSARGLVTREECATDARGAFAVLTNQGRRAIEAAAPLHVQEVRECFIDALTPAQQDALAEISAAVLARIDAIEASSNRATAS